MAKIKHVISKEDLYEYYIVQNHTIVDCASFFGASISTIKANINKYDMKYEKNKSNTFEDIDIHTFYLNVQKENIADQYIISAICNQDFPPLIPKLKKRNVEGVNFLFVNKTKHTLLHIYDDRGAYILTSNSEDYDYYTNLYREDLFIEEE